MPLSLYEVSAPVFARSLADMAGWLDKAEAEGRDEAAFMAARLAPDMRPLPAQFQMASDSAKNAVGRLAGVEAPAMADTEASFAELRDRVRRTIAFIEGVDPAAFDGAEDREVVFRVPSGGWRWSGREYLTGFALPNFFFHVTTAYAILRHAGVGLGKPDFLRHVGPPHFS
jgi:hypothetical protein